MEIDPQCSAVLTRALAALPPGVPLDVPRLLTAICCIPEVQARIPAIADYLAVSVASDLPPAPDDLVPRLHGANLSAAVGRIFAKKWPSRRHPLGAEELLLRILKTDEGRNFARYCCIPASEIDTQIAALEQDHGQALEQLDYADLLQRLREIHGLLSTRRPGVDRGPDRGPLVAFQELCEQMGFNHRTLESTRRRPQFSSRYIFLEPEHELHKLGNDLYKISAYRESASCFTIVLQLDANLLESYFNRALAYTRLGKYHRAEADLQKVNKLKPDLPECIYTLGLVAEYRRRYDLARERYERALELDPHYEKARKQLTELDERETPVAPLSMEEDTMRSDPDSTHDAERMSKQQEARALTVELKRHFKAPHPRWRGTEIRERVVRFLEPYFGTMLTKRDLRDPELIGVDRSLESIYCTLQKVSRSNIILRGQAGIGKTALVREMAYRMLHRQAPFEHDLFDYDIFELNPARMQSNTKYAGTYEEKIESLTSVLAVCPRVIVFIDEIHSFFRSGVSSDYDVFWRGNQRFKTFLADGTVTFIGCTTPPEFRRHIESDRALARRFTPLTLDPPTPQITLTILQRLLATLSARHAVTASEEMLHKIIALTEEFMPNRYQPDKSIQLLEEALSRAKLQRRPQLPETAVRAALEDVIGRSPVDLHAIREEDVFAALRKGIRGQDATLRGIARAVVAGLGNWMPRPGPRGVFFFAGPTGVGKTEAAVQIAKLLGGGQDILVRIDCNTLQGHGWNSEEITRRLLGPPPGIATHGGGGLLTLVRDRPESVVLFDEFEKADPTVARLLLQIVDTGRVRDSEDERLDFRRAFIILTTNLGFDQTSASITGFQSGGGQQRPGALDAAAFRAACQRHGLVDEFLGRISHTFLFDHLERGTVLEILQAEIDAVRAEAARRDLKLICEEGVIPHLADSWEPREGARQLHSLVCQRVLEHLCVAEAAGDLRQAKRIRLRVAKPPVGGQSERASARRRRRGDTVYIYA